MLLKREKTEKGKLKKEKEPSNEFEYATCSMPFVPSRDNKLYAALNIINSGQNYG